LENKFLSLNQLTLTLDSMQETTSFFVLFQSGVHRRETVSVNHASTVLMEILMEMESAIVTIIVLLSSIPINKQTISLSVDVLKALETAFFRSLDAKQTSLLIETTAENVDNNVLQDCFVLSESVVQKEWQNVSQTMESIVKQT